MTNKKVEDAIKRLGELKAKKNQFIPMFELVSEFVLLEKYDAEYPTPLVNSEVFDQTAADACAKLAGIMAGMLWQNGAKSVLLEPPKGMGESVEGKLYFDEVNDIVREALDDPRAGFATALEEYLLGQCSFGTGGPAVFEGQDADLNFEAWGVKEISIDEGFGGLVNVIYREYCWPLSRVIQTYGLENLSEVCKEKAKNGKLDDKIKILHVIEPRDNLKYGNLSNLNMPYKSCHIEIEQKHLISESGYEELPAAIVRFYKESGPYGRSPSMKLMPAILEINATKEARIAATEKALDPPIGVYNDSLFGNQKIKTTAAAINVLKRATGKTGSAPPIFPMYEGGDAHAADPRVEELKQDITTGYGLDRLLDFNNEAQMTLGEAQLRDRIRGESFGSFFMRQFTGLSMIIERSVAILFRRGRLGVIRGSIQHQMALDAGENPLVIPDRIAKLIMAGQSFYQIKYLSPAARLMQTQDAQGVLRTWEFAGQVAPANPEIMDNLDADESLRVVAGSAGAPSTILLAKERIEKIREQRSQMLEEKAALEQAQAGADIAATASNIKQPA